MNPRSTHKLPLSRVARHLPLAAILAALAIAQSASAAVTVTPFRIEETRVATFGDDNVSRGTLSLRLTVSLAGPEVDKFTEYGKVTIEEGVDDKGSALPAAKDIFHEAGKYKEFSNAFFRNSKFNNSAKAAPPQAELNLTPASRAATKISRLRGSLELADKGTLRTFELGGLAGPGKKTLAIPSNSVTSITVSGAPGQNVRSLSIEFAGDESGIDSIEVVDAAGKKVSNGISSWSINGGPVQKSLGLSQPLDNSMKLVVKAIADRHTLKVPFDLRDIPLP
ncbi:MAG: hypothetical protein U1F98_00425 [Verrucomicrobiota bacterium]